MNRILKYSLWVSVFALVSCQDFLEPKSQNEYVPELIQSLDELLLGEVYMGYKSVDGDFYRVLGLFDDDVTTRPDLPEYSDAMEDPVIQTRLAYTWAKDMKKEFDGYNTYGSIYQKILGCNAVLDYVDDVQGSEEEKNKVVAQALALRGYFYFHLVNLYGKPYSFDKNALGVPLKLESGLVANGLKRNTVAEVYGQILEDLLEAERLFLTFPEEDRNLHDNRINLPAIQLVLSRVYLYMEDWEKALTYSEKVIGDYNYKIRDLNTMALPSASGTPSYTDYYTWDNPEVMFLFGNRYDTYWSVNKQFAVITPPPFPGYPESSQFMMYCIVSDDLIESFDREPGVHDLRKDHYLVKEYGGKFQSKYYIPVSKIRVEKNYSLTINTNSGWGTMFRVSEAYLNGAEAAAELYKKTGQGNYLTTSSDLIDQLRINRVATGTFKGTSISDPDKMIEFVRNERRLELCFEHHRWFDLRRYGMDELKHVWYDKDHNATEYVLEKNDPGYTLQLPDEAFESNSGLIQNEERK